MGASDVVRLSVCVLLAGCGAVVQPGLANAPVLLGGGTPETRVHDAIANGHDACERASFPEGEVLRGHIPPCTKAEVLMGTVALAPPAGETWLPESYPVGVCPGRERASSVRAERAAAGFWFEPVQLSCEPPP